MANESFLPLLKRLEFSQNPNIKKKVVFALGQIRTSESENSLVNIFNNPDYIKLKKEIILALGQCADINGSSFLLNNLQNFAFETSKYRSMKL